MKTKVFLSNDLNRQLSILNLEDKQYIEQFLNNFKKPFQKLRRILRQDSRLKDETGEYYVNQRDNLVVLYAINTENDIVNYVVVNVFVREFRPILETKNTLMQYLDN